jgi:hypothetical protein
MHQKEIVYDRETRDYAMYLDGELVGFARTYHEAEVTLDQLTFDLSSQAASALAAANPSPAPSEPPGNDCPDHGPHTDSGCPKCRSINAGRQVFRHFHRRPRHFVETLRRLDPAIWQPLAEALVAYRGGTLEQTLLCWHLAVSETQHIPSDYRADLAHPILIAADATISM